METIWIETPFGKVHGKSAGPAGGPLLFCIHGWSQRNGWHTWAPLMEPLAGAGFQIVAVDMPGWGNSPVWENGIVGDAAASAVLAMLDALSADTAVLLGKSWGGGVALSLASSTPDRVTKLILTAPAAGGNIGALRISQPTLIAWAEDDPVIPIRWAAAYQNAIPHAVLVTFPRGGHSAAMKNADAFAPIAIRFLKSGGVGTGQQYNQAE